MPEHTILRGKVIAYPAEANKGLVEVRVGAYDSLNDTVLARVEQSMSGVYWLPEIDDVVEVALPSLPGYEARVIHVHRKEQDQQTGDCWTETNDRKQLRTRSGHTLTLDDTQEQTQISLRTAGGLELMLEDKEQTLSLRSSQEETPFLTLDIKKEAVRLFAGKSLTITCGKTTLSIDESGNVSIQAQGSLSLSGKEISLEAQSKLTGKGQQLELSGTMGASLTGQNQLQLVSTGITQVKGSMIKLN